MMTSRSEYRLLRDESQFVAYRSQAAVGVMGTGDVSFNAQFSAGEVSYKVETYVMGLDGQYGAAETKTCLLYTSRCV